MESEWKMKNMDGKIIGTIQVPEEMLASLRDFSKRDVAELEAPAKAELEGLRKFKAGIDEAFGSPESFCELATRLGFETCLPKASQEDVAQVEEVKSNDGGEEQPEKTEPASEVEYLAKFLSGDEV